MASFLTYLDAEQGGFRLRLAFGSSGEEARDRGGISSFPFRLVLDSDPFTRVVEAEVISDSGSPVTRVCLLMQRDLYQHDSARSFASNPEVTDLWQRAFFHHSQAIGPHPPIILSAQISPESGFSAFDPLFYCKFKEAYFPPTCPDCGIQLELCNDDRLLSALSLPVYSASLERFLHCRYCSGSSSSPIFYMHSEGGFAGSPDPRERAQPQDARRPADSDSRASVKDCAALIDDYRRLLGRGDPSGDHPCPKCSSRVECFGPSRKALVRLTPFSFYPFFVLTFSTLPRGASRWPPLLHGLPALQEVDEPRLDRDVLMEQEPGRESEDPESKTICAILDSIQAKWWREENEPRIEPAWSEPTREGKRREPAPTSPSRFEESPSAGVDEVEDTMILLRDEDLLNAPKRHPVQIEANPETVYPEETLVATEPFQPKPPPEEPPKPADEIITETIVIHTGEFSEEATMGRAPAGGVEEADLETVRLDTGAASMERPETPSEPTTESEELFETVVMGDQSQEPRAPAPRPEGFARAAVQEPDATVVLSNGLPPAKSKRKKPASDEELDETVILSETPEKDT